MGSSSCLKDEDNNPNRNREKEKNIFIDNEYIISSQIKIKDESILPISKSLCKIKEVNKVFSEGFLIKFFKGKEDFYCLMTNRDNITKNMIEKKEKINLEYDNGNKNTEIILNSCERYIKEFIDINIDAIIIEILPKDNVVKDFFLLPYIEYMDNYKELINKEITIVQNQNDKIIHSQRTIKDIINRYEIIYYSNKEKISPGNPIFINDSKNVIAINKGSKNNNYENYGYCIGPIYNYFKNLFKYKYELKNGDHYIGELLNGIPNGRGIKYDKNGKIKYEGNVINGKAEGSGKYNYENGFYYIGQWKNDMKNGKGILYYKNGNILYNGDFINNKYEGKGKFIAENGEYYEGEFKNNLFHGKGIIYYENGYKKYEGDFKNDKFEGNGKYIYENGHYYDGEWKNGLKNGNGIIYFSNGNIKYEGLFNDDKPVK